MTYDLRQDYLANGYGEEETAEFDSPETIQAIEQALQELGHETDRIGNIFSLTSRLSAGDRWDMVFNIAEGLRGFGREAQVPALLEAYGIAYTFSDPLVLSLSLHKGVTKHVVRDLGIPTPEFHVVESRHDIEKVDLPYPVFAKPVAEGTGKGISASSKIETEEQLREVCTEMLAQYRQPVLVETFLPGKEYTVGIVGTGIDARAVGTMEVILGESAEPEVYSYWNKEHFEGLVTYRLVRGAVSEEAEKMALAVWNGLGCRDAGRLDLRSDTGGALHFLEVNPLAGLHPKRSDLCILGNFTGTPYVELIRAILLSASSRLNLDLRINEKTNCRDRSQRTRSTGQRLFRSVH